MIAIYEILNIHTGERYIGESLNLAERWSYHLEQLNNKTHENYKLQIAWNEWGASAFSFRTLATIDINSFPNKIYQKCLLLFFENLYIQKYDTINTGYNIENSFYKVLRGKKKCFGKVDKDICLSVWDRYDKGKIVNYDGFITKPIQKENNVVFGTKLF